MALIVYPADAVSGAPSYTGQNVRDVQSAFLGGASSSRPLGCRSGVRPGTPSSTVTATSTTWTVKSHAGVVDAEVAASAGPYLYALDANTSGAMTAADGTNPRIDLISVQISDPAESDGSSTPSAAIVYTTGVPAATPTAPATPARSLTLAQINVPKSGGGSPSVSWVAPNLNAPGGIVAAAGSSAYPATPYVGQYVDDASLGLMRWDGSQWQRIGLGGDTDWTAVPATSGWTSSLQARIRNGWVQFEGTITKASGNISNTAAVQIASLPSVSFAPAGEFRSTAFGYLTGGTPPAYAQGFIEIATGTTAINMTWNQQGAFNTLFFTGLGYPANGS